ncbi:MAG: HDIG domain-containing protein [Paludibacteraceae bacterium]|nr:HDIG domain-containing protein [Paludibacteraceae bacterium]
MNPFDILNKYYDVNSDLYKILVEHSHDVANKALMLAKNRLDLHPDLVFIEEAAMLHDIGVSQTFAPDIFCDGTNAYICHGYLGSAILMREGYPLHAMVCERHTGTGLSLAYIEKEELPLPCRNMLPISIEEQIICFADKFFSKTHLGEERSLKTARFKLEKYGPETVARFDNWCKMFL